MHRDPGGESYKAVATVEVSGALEIQALPGVTIPVASIFS